MSDDSQRSCGVWSVSPRAFSSFADSERVLKSKTKRVRQSYISHISHIGVLYLRYHLQLNLVKQITSDPVHRIVSAEQRRRARGSFVTSVWAIHSYRRTRRRTIVAGYKAAIVLDNELNLVASCNAPFAIA